jgi:hypothetical protein
MEEKKTGLAPAIRKETRRVAIYVIIGVAVMFVVFAILHGKFPERVPFDLTVILGGICGGIVAVLNFFLMGVTVQKVTDLENEADARNMMKASYSRRMMMQGVWVVLAILLPCFQFAAGLIPLLFPGIGIKIANLAGVNE